MQKGRCVSEGPGGHCAASRSTCCRFSNIDVDGCGDRARPNGPAVPCPLPLTHAARDRAHDTRAHARSRNTRCPRCKASDSVERSSTLLCERRRDERSRRTRPLRAASHIAVMATSPCRHLALRGRPRLPSAPSSPRYGHPRGAVCSRRAVAWREAPTRRRIRRAFMCAGRVTLTYSPPSEIYGVHPRGIAQRYPQSAHSCHSTVLARCWAKVRMRVWSQRGHAVVGRVSNVGLIGSGCSAGVPQGGKAMVRNPRMCGRLGQLQLAYHPRGVSSGDCGCMSPAT
jgi:hypothetical protein